MANIMAHQLGWIRGATICVPAVSLCPRVIVSVFVSVSLDVRLDICLDICFDVF